MNVLKVHSLSVYGQRQWQATVECSYCCASIMSRWLLVALVKAGISAAVLRVFGMGRVWHAVHEVLW